MIYIFIILYRITFIKSEATFQIYGLNHTETRCVYEKGYFQFVFIGQLSGISDQISFNLPLKSPETCKEAECIARNNYILCKMDAYEHDLSGEKMVEVYEEEPNIPNFKFTNWEEYFIIDNRIINDATNCKPEGIGPGPKHDDLIFASFEIQDLQMLGCFRNKNNFSFKLTTIKDDKSLLKNTLEQDIYFEITFKKPNKESALCVLLKNQKNDDFYIARCAIEYGGEIEVDKEVNSTIFLEEKNYTIIFRSSLISPITVDECKEKGILASFEVKNIEILGCFRNKNNFSFNLTKIDDKNILKDKSFQDIYFEMSFKKPKDEKALCVIPKNNKNDDYKVRCAIEYGGEIEVGREANGIVNYEGEEYIILFNGLSIQKTKVDECINEI